MTSDKNIAKYTHTQDHAENATPNISKTSTLKTNTLNILEDNVTSSLKISDAENDKRKILTKSLRPTTNK